MKLPFLDRHEESARFRRLLDRTEGALGVVYGRRRCGKSRLLREILPPARAVYYVGDDREASLQRASLATEIGRLLPGFERVTYPDWDSLLARWWREARPGTVLALDEFPSLVVAGRELPSLLQKYLDREAERGIHLLLSGSSQRMMQRRGWAITSAKSVRPDAGGAPGSTANRSKSTSWPTAWMAKAFSSAK